jgi:DNA-binding CsgD family transcriptional regulator
VAHDILSAAEAYVRGSALAPELAVRREAELLLATARAHDKRVRGRPDPEAWDELARAWTQHSVPYRRAKARWWQALAILASAPEEEDRESARVKARQPLAEAYRLARALPALPLLREIVDLGKRARVPLPVTADEDRGLVAVGPGKPDPVAVGPGLDVASDMRGGDIARAIEDRVIASLRKGPVDTYGLSPREREVLNIVAEGRTDRDIAARLFISERTVHVHVRRILSKLGVSSRTEAAGVAIRQGLVPTDASSALGLKGADDVASRP